MADERTASTKEERLPLTLPGLRVEVERLREELESMRGLLREEGKRMGSALEQERSAALQAGHERDLERDRRTRLEKEVADLRREAERGRNDHDGRLRAEERARAIDEAAKLIERNLESILDRRERSISEKDRVIASLARALGSAERERDILVDTPGSGAASLLRRILGVRRVLAPAPRRVGPGKPAAAPADSPSAPAGSAPAAAPPANGSPAAGPEAAPPDAPSPAPASAPAP